MIRNLTVFLFFFFLSNTYLFADMPHYLDFKYILNESNAGKKAQKNLKEKLDKGIKSLNNKEKSLQEEEKKLIQQKKVISAEEYKKKINELREKVLSLRKNRNKILEDIAIERKKARNILLKNLNPIIQDYMQEKGIRLVIDKKNLILADEKLDITKDIIKLLNDKLKEIKLN